MRLMTFIKILTALLLWSAFTTADDSLSLHETSPGTDVSASEEGTNDTSAEKVHQPVTDIPTLVDTPFISMAGDCRYPAISTEGTALHITWIVTEGVTSNIYYMKSSDEGETWSDARRVSSDYGDCYPPTIAAGSGIVHCAWVDYAERIDGVLYYTRSIDGGETWEESHILLPDANGTRYPLLSCRGNDVYLVRQDVENKVYFMASYNNGMTWQKETLMAKIGRKSCYCYPPAIAAGKNDIVMVWADLNEAARGPQIGINGVPLFKSKNRVVTAVAYRRSSDRGRSWSKPQVLSSATVSMETREEIDNPILVSDSVRYYLFWLDRRDNMLGEIFYSSFDTKKMKLPLEGKKVYPIEKRSPKRPTVVFDRHGDIHFTWANFFNGQSVISYGKIDQAGVHLVKKRDLTETAGSYHNPVITRTASGLLHLFWFVVPKENKNENNDWSRIFYKTSSNNGVTWENGEPKRRDPSK